MDKARVHLYCFPKQNAKGNRRTYFVTKDGEPQGKLVLIFPDDTQHQSSFQIGVSLAPIAYIPEGTYLAEAPDFLAELFLKILGPLAK
jgi:hypothetical protein